MVTNSFFCKVAPLRVRLGIIVITPVSDPSRLVLPKASSVLDDTPSSEVFSASKPDSHGSPRNNVTLGGTGTYLWSP